MSKNLIKQLLNEIERVKDENYDGFYKLTFDEKTGFSLSKDETVKKIKKNEQEENVDFEKDFDKSMEKAE